MQRNDVSLISRWKMQTLLAECSDYFPALPFDNRRDHNQRLRIIDCVEHAIIRRTGMRLDTDCSVEKVFTKIQDRVDRRLEGIQVACLALRLPHQAPDDDPPIIERDDADSWEIVLELAKEFET